MTHSDKSMHSFDRPLRKWNEHATVRHAPRRVICDQPGAYYFLPANTPLSQHPEVVRLGHAVIRELQVRQLLRYLEFTRVLELEFVNPLLAKIVAGHFDGLFSPGQRVDALKVYTDEGYHALFSIDLKEQVMAATGVRMSDVETPAFQPRFRQLLNATGSSDVQSLFELLAVSTHEQLITGSLRRANDPKLISGVRELLLDHARDEAAHAVYFSSVFDAAWKSSSEAVRRIIAPGLADVVCCFLEPDVPNLKEDLLHCGFSDSQAVQIVAEAYPEAERGTARRVSAEQPLRLFGSLGIFELPRVKEYFASFGLVD